jgi:RimJ/RimL family protein N-acetyltransferase
MRTQPGPRDQPVVSDDVVTLRPWSSGDAEFMAAAFADPAIRRYNGQLDADGYPGPSLSVADATADIEEFASSWRAFAETGRPTGVVFAITDARSGVLAGCCGVDAWSDERVAQIGYWLAPGARGRGLATQATVLLTRWLFAIGAVRVFLTVVAGNEASMAVARRAGFEHEATLPSHSAWMGERLDVLVFGKVPPMEANPARR